VIDMTLIGILLIILSIITLVLVISIKYYQPMINFKDDEEYFEDDGVDYHPIYEAKVDSIKKDYPLLQYMFEFIEVKHGIILHWLGASNSKKNYLYSFTNSKDLDKFMKTINQINRDNMVMDKGVYIVYPYFDRLYDLCLTECRDYLGCIDGVLIDKHNLNSEFVGVGLSSYVKIEVRGNQDRIDNFINDLDVKKLSSPAKNSINKELMKDLGYYSIKRLLIDYPNYDFMFYPMIDRDGNVLHVYGCK